jgi:Flp pilus assembly protein TadD
MSKDNPDTFNPPALFAEENEAAEALVSAGNLPEAAKKLVEIVELDPDNHRAYNTIGIIAWMRKA